MLVFSHKFSLDQVQHNICWNSTISNSFIPFTPSVFVSANTFSLQILLILLDFLLSLPLYLSHSVIFSISLFENIEKKKIIDRMMRTQWLLNSFLCVFYWIQVHFGHFLEKKKSLVQHENPMKWTDFAVIFSVEHLWYASCSPPSFNWNGFVLFIFPVYLALPLPYLSLILELSSALSVSFSLSCSAVVYCWFRLQLI